MISAATSSSANARSTSSPTPKTVSRRAVSSAGDAATINEDTTTTIPVLINDSDVRITDISVRSALMRVRWNDMPVRRIDSSTEMLSGERTKAMRPSRGGRLMVTPCACRRAQAA